jgi:hypothetical protein
VRLARSIVSFAALAISIPACMEPELSTQGQELSTAVRHERYRLIRDAAAEMGLYNAALLAGVAISETNLAHCQSEATYACKGPASPSCNGEPIIAGAADGPCADMQGGLGMFQFDAGTYAQTLATYGDSILTIEGNTAQAVNFVVVRAQQSIAAVDDWLGAVAWMNDVPMQAGLPKMEEWAVFIVCRYNGCCSTSSTCTSRRNGYRDNAIKAYQEMGGDFWRTSDRCAQLPADGVIDERSACYLAGGDPRFWRRAGGGYADTREWTGTTSAARPANFARWLVKTGRATRYHVDVHLDGGELGTATRAAYVIAHAGQTETVVVDQTSASGWISLGEFDFAGTGDEYVMLGDNTGDGGQQLLFDAVRVLPLDGGPTDADDPGGCCDASGRGRATSVGGMLLVALALRRRRRAQ